MSTDHLAKNQRMRPGVKALIVHEGKILIISENVVSNGNKIVIRDFPGGGLDFGENLKDALVREVKEEVGLNIKVGKVVGAWDFVLGSREHNNSEKNGTHIVCIGYQCSVAGEVKIDLTKNPAQEDIFECKWFTKEELLAKESNFVRHKGMIETLNNLNI